MIRSKIIMLLTASLCGTHLTAMDSAQKEEKISEVQLALRSMVRVHQSVRHFKDAKKTEAISEVTSEAAPEPQNRAVRSLLQVQDVDVSPNSECVAALICPSEESNFNETYAVVYGAQDSKIRHQREFNRELYAPNMFHIRYNLDGDLIALGGYRDTEQGDKACVHIYDKTLSQLLKKYENEPGEVISFAWATKQLLLASIAQLDWNAARNDTEGNRAAYSFAPCYNNARIVALGMQEDTSPTVPGGKSKNFIAVDDANGIVWVNEQARENKLYVSRNGQVSPLEFPDKKFQAQRVAFSPNYQYLACAGRPGDKGGTAIYLVKNQESAYCPDNLLFDAHDGDVSDMQIKRISFTSDGELIAYADTYGGNNNYGSFCIFDAKTQELVDRVGEYLVDGQLAPNGKFAAIAGTGNVHIVSLAEYVNVAKELEEMERGITAE